MQSWILMDLIIFVIFSFCIWWGVRKGFMRAAYQILSIVATIIIVMLFQGSFTTYLTETPIGETVQTKVQVAVSKAIGINGEKTNPSEVIEKMGLPTFMTKGLQSQTQLIEDTKENIIQSVTQSLTTSIMGMVSTTLLFVGIRISLWILLRILDNICKLPVLNLVNKMAGAIVGGINALLIVYILCALIMLITPIEKASELTQSIEKTQITKYFYERNLLMEFFI